MVSNMVHVNHVKTLQKNVNKCLKEICEFAQIINPTASCYLKMMNELIDKANQFN